MIIHISIERVLMLITTLNGQLISKSSYLNIYPEIDCQISQGDSRMVYK